MNEEDFELDPTNEDRISLEASAWIAKRDEGFSAKDQDAFHEWLAIDPVHKEVYAERLAFWEQMNELADWRPDHSREPNPDLLAWRMPSKWKSRMANFGGIAAAIAIGLTVFIYREGQDRSDPRILAFGGAHSYENHVLDDGSIVELNRGAQVSVQYTSSDRLVFLHTGEAHFMVAKDTDRPFQVHAGDTVVEATGTAFSVALEDDGINVMVTEGRVLVDAPSLVASQNDVGFMKLPARELVAGQMSKIAPSNELIAPAIATISAEEIDRKLAWKGEDLDFTAVPLSEVAEEFNRRNRVKVVIGDPELKELEITAKLRSNNLEGFIELLDVTMNVTADRAADYEISLRNKILEL
jgi:transmembrane sensor